MRIQATSLRQLSPPLRYFVLSETLHFSIIKFGNVIVSRLLVFISTTVCLKTRFEREGVTGKNEYRITLLNLVAEVI